MSRQIAHYLAPSNYISEFNDNELHFADYIGKMQEIIREHHTHQPQFSQATIIEANSPFDWPTENATHGVVLIHGLTDSAFQMKDIGIFFKRQGFWVRSITLPGHGTMPGDLTRVQLATWQKAVAYAVSDLAKRVSNIYLCGYSTGGALALEFALRLSQIQGLILFAPALRLKRYIEMAVRAQMWVKTFWKRADWLSIEPELDYAKYSSLSVNGAFQLQLLINTLAKQIPQTKSAIPTFMVMSDADELIDYRETVSLYRQLKHPLNQLLVYSQQSFASEKGIIYRTSCYPEQKIVNFPHIGLATAPSNIHYGEQGDYLPYLNCQGNPQVKDIYKGALKLTGPKNYRLQRLTYNPDYTNLLDLLNDWLISIHR
ncbi:MAG: Thermostable monoacylglycerol lipase [Gammaproteobacteria bacterium]|jgi:esterase/lipase|nr:Thermostable monoacylglycerol lipase [Gammaproteobacteria bacterium]